MGYRGPDLVPDYGYDTHHYIKITAQNDETVIRNIVINRDNCLTREVMKFPIRLSFGQAIDFETLCDPLEVAVETSAETLNFTFEK